VSSYSWFIGCGLGFVVLVALERRHPQIPVLDPSDPGVNLGDEDEQASVASARTAG
jgi:NCS1 family nucleobase:cation symporter-1